MQTSPILRLYCRDCDKERNHDVLHSHTPTPDSGAAGQEYQMVQCRGCETISFRELLIEDGAEPVSNLYPPRLKRAAKNYHASGTRVPSEIANVYKATIDSFNNGAANESSYILSAAGIRCLLELICDNLNVSIGEATLEAKIRGLARADHITENHARLLQQARFLGNDALHRGEIPSEENLTALLNVFEQTIDVLYVMPEIFALDEILDATVLAIGPEEIVLKVGKSTRGYMPVSEFDVDAPETAAVGAQFQAMVIDNSDRVMLSKRRADDKRRQADEKLLLEEKTRKEAEELTRLFPSGDLLEATVTTVRNDGVSVEVSRRGKTVPGRVSREELGVKPELAVGSVVKVGDVINAMILSNEKGLLTLSRKQGDRKRALLLAEESYQRRTIVSVRVQYVSPNGLSIRFCSPQDMKPLLGVEGFLPFDLLDETGVANRNDWKGKTLPARVIKLENQTILLNHRMALADLRRIWSGVEEGKCYRGRVTRLVNGGVVVTVRGIDGLLRISPDNPIYPALEDTIEVEITRLDFTQQKMWLAAASETGAPSPAGIAAAGRQEARQRVQDAFVNKTILKGEALRKEPDGERLFVQIEAGVSGYVHKTQVGRYDPPALDWWIGKEIPVRITGSIGPATQLDKLALSHRAALKEDAQQQAALNALTLDQWRSGTVLQSSEEVAVIEVEGAQGALRAADSGGRTLCEGETLDVRVRQLDVAQNRMYLSLLASDPVLVTDMEDSAQEQYTEANEAAPVVEDANATTVSEDENRSDIPSLNEEDWLLGAMTEEEDEAPDTLDKPPASQESEVAADTSGAASQPWWHPGAV